MAHSMPTAAHVLRASTTALRRVGDEPVLLVERYDRASSTTAGHPMRLHQEDLCQALGRLSSQKYERFEDGVAKGPTIAEIVELLRRRARPSVQQVDDVDAHSKNYSLLYQRDMRRFQIAPTYDAICVSAFHGHAIDDRVARHQADDTTAHDLLETTCVELHGSRRLGDFSACAFPSPFLHRSSNGSTDNRSLHLLIPDPACLDDALPAGPLSSLQ